MKGSQRKNDSNRWQTWRLYLLILIPVILIVAGTSFTYYRFAEKVSIKTLQQQAKFRLELQIDAFKNEIEMIVSDLLVLAGHQQLNLITDGSEVADYTALADEFLVFSRSKKMYDQARFLDASGMEVIRINFNQGYPEIVPTDQLQSKGERYYFKDTYKLKEGELYVSPLDLNIESGTVERPFKPTLRFGLPVFNVSGEKAGVVILNYFGKKLIEHIDKATFKSNAVSFDMLLNSDGYFFKGMRKEDEWGFMLAERIDKTFSHFYPAQWENIKRNSSGQFLGEQGLFTFTTVYPLTEGLKSSSGSSQAFGASVKSLNADQYHWKIVSFIPRTAIQSMTSQLRQVLLSFNLLFLLLAGVGFWFLSRAIMMRQAAEAAIAHMAHFDMLTELPNRPLLHDRLSMSLATAKREKTPLSVFFLDLDGFKGINDSFGHEAGDHVLVEVAHRLQQCVREVDTVARMGGDEFVLVLTSTTGQEAAGIIATRIINALSEPILINNQACNIGASIGIANYPKDGETRDALLTKADAAMYDAKESGKNTYRFCS